ncbi:MAG: gas vesicle protein GvpK [bacterium]|nr:gas vesicle protein GvpK [bacterium]
MPIDIDEDNLKHGVLGLVIALVEIIKDALNLQAIKRMEGEGLEEKSKLTEKEMERLGEALMDLDVAIEEIKKEQGVTESVKSVRDGLDDIVDEVVDKMVNPERWREEAEEKGI